MIRVLIYIAITFLLALGVAWVADRPGVVTLDWQGYRIETSLLIGVMALGAVVAAAVIVLGLIRALLRSPKIATRFFKRRRRDRGYEALSKGLVALGVGDAVSAKRFGGEAAKLLKNAPAAKLLLAQAAQMSGDRDDARARFEAMLEDPQLRPVALHGLFVEAERLEHPVAALHYANEAAELVSGLPWAGRAVLGYQALAGDWDAAIKALERNYATKLVDKKTFRRRKAVLMTAYALQLEDGEPDRARTLALEAHGLAQNLVPAAVVGARLCTRRGDIRKAMKVVETCWKQAPHPDLAETYANARTGDSAQDRLKRMKHLAKLKPEHTESELAVAKAAIDARDWILARERLKKIVRSDPSQRAFLLMADLEEQENGDRGRVREWLSRAVKAPADPAWVADGVVSEAWAPISPVTGRIDAYEWKTPNSGLAIAAQVDIDDALLEELPLQVEQAGQESGEAMADIKSSAARDEGTGPIAKQADTEQVSAAEREKTVSGAPDKELSPDKAPQAKEEAEEGKPAASETVEGVAPPKEKKELRAAEFPLKHMPDDPGPENVETSGEAKSGGRFFS